MATITLKDDIRIKQTFKNISESSFSKIIFIDNIKLTQKGWLLEDIVLQSLINNHKLFVPVSTHGFLSFASGEALDDTKKIVGDRHFKSGIPVNKLISKNLHLNSSAEEKMYHFTKLFTNPGGLIELFCSSGIANKNFSYTHGGLKLTIYSVKLDNPLFNFVASDDGTVFKRAKIKNLDVFKFLQKYAGDYAFDIVYPKGESFDDSEPAIASNPGAWLPTTTDPDWSQPVSNRNLSVNTNQQWLEANYPKDQRKDLKELKIQDNSLEGELDLSDFTSLEKLLCYGNNNITKLILPPQNNLEWIDAGYNSLTDLDFLNNLDPSKLKGLKIHQNNIQEQDLSCFSRFTNLTDLAIGNCYNYGGVEAIDKGNYNKFFGSLQPLQNLSRLENLTIWNSNIDSGLEHLPENLKTIHCSNEGPANWKCKNLLDQLEKHNMNNIEKDSYNYQSWLTQTKASIVSGQN